MSIFLYFYISICIYVYMYICIHVYMYICIYVYMYICIYVYMYICIYVYIYTYMYICIYVYTYICIYVYMDICIFVYLYICIYAYISNAVCHATPRMPPINCLSVVRAKLCREIYVPGCGSLWKRFFTTSSVCDNDFCDDGKFCQPTACQNSFHCLIRCVVIRGCRDTV